VHVKMATSLSDRYENHADFQSQLELRCCLHLLSCYLCCLMVLETFVLHLEILRAFSLTCHRLESLSNKVLVYFSDDHSIRLFFHWCCYDLLLKVVRMLDY